MRSAAVAKTPQAVVKIIGFTHSRKSIKRQVNYISREGKEPIENEAGADDTGEGVAKRVLEAWADKATPGQTVTGKRERLSMHVQASMPAGTDVERFREIARAWGDQVFAGRQYVFAVHDDKKHPHAHFLVALKDDNGRKLNPRKDDLQAWRESFAELATTQGYPMAATRWYEHRQDKPPREASHTPSYRMLERGEVSKKLVDEMLTAIAGPPRPALLPQPIAESQDAHRKAAEAHATEGRPALAELHARAAETPRRGRTEAIRAEVDAVATGASPVSPKMRELAEKIAAERGVELPRGADGDFGAVRAFLNQYARRQIDGPKGAEQGQGAPPPKTHGPEREA